jgi:hypothetical protein
MKKPMEIPVNATVQCLDGPGGHTTGIILNPVTRVVSHIVVRVHGILGPEVVVPVEEIVESSRQLIRLRLTGQQLTKRPSFVQSAFGRPDEDLANSMLDAVFIWPFKALTSDHAGLSPETMGIRPGDYVDAADGNVGRVDEFLVDPQTLGITHLVLREGHRWDRREVTIPITEVERIEPGRVTLKLSKPEVAALPAVPARQREHARPRDY